MPRRLSETVYEFESFLAVERNLAPGTRREYVADVERFFAHLTEQRGAAPQLDRIDANDLRGYLERLYERKRLSPARLSRLIASLRQFFKFCVQRRYIRTNPAAAIQSPRKVKKLPVFLLAGELRHLFDAPDRSEWQGRRDYAILVALGFAGLRLAELTHLELDDVDFRTSQLKVLGKGSKERFVPMNALVSQAFKEYLEVRPASAESAVFVNKSGGRLSGRSIQKMIKKYGLMSGIFKKGLSPHKLRHTFATLLHMKDVDILEIQKLLGHSSITSTQIYTHTHPGKLKSAVDKLTEI